jgi:hypothetical protein
MSINKEADYLDGNSINKIRSDDHEEFGSKTQRGVPNNVLNKTTEQGNQLTFQDTNKSSSKVNFINSLPNNRANLEKEKLFETFMMFQDFLQMMKNSSNLDKADGKNSITSENPEDKAHESNNNRKKNLGYYDENEINKNINTENSIKDVRESNKIPRENSVRSEPGLIINQSHPGDHSNSLMNNQEEEGSSIKTNDLKFSFKKNSNKQESNSFDKNSDKKFSKTKGSKTFRNYEATDDRSEKQLDFAKYEIVDDKYEPKSKSVKRVQLKKTELTKQAEKKRGKSKSDGRITHSEDIIITTNQTDSNFKKKEDDKQIKKIVTKTVYKRNVSSNKNTKDKPSDELMKRLSETEFPFRNYDEKESDQVEYKIHSK